MKRDWVFFLNPLLTSPEMAELKRFIANERQTKNVYPASADVFRAFTLCSYKDTKVVILGQDPYCESGSADGLCFSSLLPGRSPELGFIFNEIYNDLNVQYEHNVPQKEVFPSNSLANWSTNGILLLNSVLTVQEGSPGSHRGMGWERLTYRVIEALNKKDKPIIYLLWGKHAQAYRSAINPRHIVLEGPYPNSEEFYHNKHFSILRDIMPEIYNEDERVVVDITPFLRKTKAIKYIREVHPQWADRAEDYIKNYLTVPVWLNPHHRILYNRDFLDMLSTKPK